MALVSAAQATSVRQTQCSHPAARPRTRVPWPRLYTARSRDRGAGHCPRTFAIGAVEWDRVGPVSLQLSWPSLGAQSSRREGAILGAVLHSLAAVLAARPADRAGLPARLLSCAGGGHDCRRLNDLVVAVRHGTCLRVEA